MGSRRSCAAELGTKPEHFFDADGAWIENYQ
jgi:hypothetical protein